MPKLSQEKMELRRRTVEDAALRLFCERGFHGVGLRDIADKAGVSIGNIYNHASSKEAIFESIVARLFAAFASASEPLANFFGSAVLPDDLPTLGRVMSEMCKRHRDYLTLVHVDIAEFGGRHVRPHYEDLAARFRLALHMGTGEPPVGSFAPWVDPAVALTLIYMQYSNYFVVERFIGAKGHLGLSDEQAIEMIARVFVLGIAPRPSDPSPPHTTKNNTDR